MKEKKSLKRSFVLFVLIYVILLCSIFIAISFSKNISKLAGDGSVDVAGMILNLEKQTSTLSYITNEEQSIYFTVTNYDETDDGTITYNETTYDYHITIDVGDYITDYTLYEVDDDGNLTEIEVTDGTTESYTMPHSVAQTDTYVLKVKTDNTDYAGQADTISIDAYAVQTARII